MIFFLRIIYKIRESICFRCRNFLLKAIVRKCGTRIRVYGKPDIVNPHNIIIGSDVTINHRVYLNGYNPIIIGNHVTISAGTSIVSTGLDLSDFIKNGHNHIKNGGIFIGDNVWVGCNVSIIGDVKITGRYVVIGAGSVVTKDIIEDYSIWAGVPARKIKNIR